MTHGNGTPRPARAAEGEPLSVAEGLEVVVLNENEVLVQFGTRSTPSELLRDPELRGYMGPLFARLLDAPRPASELLATVPPEDRGDFGQLLDDLAEAGFLTVPSRDPMAQLTRYAFGGEAPLSGKSVTLLGAGPLGARIASGLLQHGVGRITLVDDRPGDAVWSRFIPFGDGSRPVDGRPARLLLTERLATGGHGDDRVRAGPAVCGEPEPLARALAGADLVVVAFERPQMRLTHLVNRLCVRDERAWLLAGLDGNVGTAGPLFLPPHTACYNCFRALADASVPNPEMSYRFRRHLAEGRTPGFFAGLPAHADLVAGYACLAAAHYLIRGSAFLIGRSLWLDFGEMSLDVEDVFILPRCPVCSRVKPAYEPAFTPRVVQAVPAS